MRTLVDGADGDVQDGTFHDVQNLSLKSLVLKDANGGTVTAISSASTPACR